MLRPSMNFFNQALKKVPLLTMEKQLLMEKTPNASCSILQVTAHCVKKMCSPHSHDGTELDILHNSSHPRDFPSEGQKLSLVE